MEQKRCKECGTEMNSNGVCPKCGKEQENFFIKHKVITFILVVIVFGVIMSFTNGNDNNSITKTNTYKGENKVEVTKQNKVEVTVIDFSTMQKADIENWCYTNKINYSIVEEYSDTVPKGQFTSQSVKANSTIYQGDKIKIIYSLGKEPSIEYKNALKKAESYSKTMHMSKKGIYKQLTSQYGEKFPADAAQYAIDNMEADWNANALAKAKSYQTTLSMSKNAIYQQLISEYGENFTKEEAQYAIDHLED